MTRQQQFLINLIVTVLNTKKNKQNFEDPDSSEDLNWETIQYLMSEKKLLTYILFVETGKFDQLKTPEIMSRVAATLQQSIAFEYEWNQLQTIFEKHGVDCLPLKGINIRNYYPDILLRPMCDLDILYREEQNETMKSALAEAGYWLQAEGIKHDHFVNDYGVHVEMHREMVEAGTSYREYYQNIWNKVRKVEGYQHIFKLSPEDEYIFVIVHMKEHFIRGEAELKMLTDVYVMQKQCDLDKEYIRKELDVIGLSEFEGNISRLAQNWFSGECKVDDDLVELSEYLLGNQKYNTEKDSFFAFSTHGNKVKYFIYAVFPSLPRMQSMFPWLRKWPVLLPAAWMIRIVRAIRYRQHNIRTEWTRLKNINKSNYEQGRELNAMFRRYGLGENDYE